MSFLLTIFSNLVVLVVSTVKFGFVASTVVAANLGIPGTVANLIGGIAGIFLFVQIDEFAQNWLIKTFPKKFKNKFSKRTRFLVRVKQTFGLAGIAFLTPIVLSIPVGVFFAMDLTTNKKKVLINMIIACIFWAAVFYVPYYVFEIDMMTWVKSFLP
jgi:membrane protein YqaA with SNARE-associated domain